ncbi:5-methylcytosine restriction system specificity protein McrC [Dietzia sp. 179-F 9C3 NHS]|uniref:5-methylcytosine restriction system specificity protein McrC n=1 Tax=Dietzia sp. 179-F 9C3 NHS TaxID=3374295 RepID=UPI00387A7BB8
MLYASELLDKLTSAERERLIGGERDNDLLDALAAILASQVEARMRSMLARGFRKRHESLSRVRGRIDHLGTARRRLMESGRILCHYDEQTVDRPRYRYMLATLRIAAHTAESEGVGLRCISTAQLLERNGVSSTDATSAEISTEQYGHFDAQDQKLVALSALVRDMCAPEHVAGHQELPAIARDERALRTLFEKAVRGFYRHHLGPSGFSVKAASRGWPAVGEPEALTFLPRLNADVVISGPGRQVIVECKFGPIFSTHEQRRKVMLEPGYLRQLYTYANVYGQGFNGETSAVLLGALVQRSLGRDLELEIAGIPFTIREVDLSLSPSAIREALMSALPACTTA